MGRKYTDEQYQEALKLYQSGMSVSKAGEAVGIKKDSFWLYLHQRGLNRPDPRPNVITGKILKEAHELLETGLTKKEVAKRLGVKPNTLNHHLNRDESRRSIKGYDSSLSLGIEKAKKALKLIKKGVPAKEIMARMGVSQTWFYSLCKQNGITFRRTLTERERKVIYQRRKAGQSLEDIAKDLGRCLSTVEGVWYYHRKRFEEEEKKEKVLQAYLLGDEIEYTSERLEIPYKEVKKMYSNFLKEGIRPNQ